MMTLLHSRSEQRDDGLYIDRETVIPLLAPLPGNEQITVQSLSGGLMACTVHTGPDLFLGQAYAALYHWMKENEYQIIGLPRLVCLRREKAQYVTEVQFPVKRQEIGE